MAIILKEIEDYEAWDEFVKGSPQGNIFSSSKWKRVVEGSTDYKGELLAFYRADEPVAGILVFSIKKGPFKVAYQPPLTPFTTLLFEKKKTDRLSKIESFEKEIIEKLDEKLKGYSCNFLVMHPLIKDIRAFTLKKWQPGVNYTYILDISDIEKLWESIDKAAKYDIKRAEEKGIKIEISDDIDTFYDIYKKTFERQNIRKFPSKKLIENILKSENSRLYLAKKEDVVIAGAVVLFDEGISYYLLAASDPAFRDEKAPSLLLWNIAKDCSKSCSRMDLVGANTPQLIKFKRDFSPSLVPYYSVKKYNSNLLKIFKNI